MKSSAVSIFKIGYRIAVMTPRDTTLALIETYYQRFNAGGDRTAFLELLTDDVEHPVNQGGIESGKAAFRQFLQRMDRCYRERIVDVVVMASTDGLHAAAEFIVEGAYLQTDDGLPPARGQPYRLPAGAFFQLRDGQVARVAVHYNLAEWMRQVGGSTV